MVPKLDFIKIAVSTVLACKSKLQVSDPKFGFFCFCSILASIWKTLLEKTEKKIRNRQHPKFPSSSKFLRGCPILTESPFEPMFCVQNAGYESNFVPKIIVAPLQKANNN